MNGPLKNGPLKKKSPCYHAHVDKHERKEKELVRCTDETCPKDGSNGCQKSHAPDGVSFHWCNFGTSCKNYNMKSEEERAEEMCFVKATKTLKMATRDVESATEELCRQNKMLADVMDVPSVDEVRVPVFKELDLSTSLPANTYKLKGAQNANEKLQDAVMQWRETHDEHSSLLDEIDASPEKLITFVLSKLAQLSTTNDQATVISQQSSDIADLKKTNAGLQKDIADLKKLVFSLLAKTTDL